MLVQIRKSNHSNFQHDVERVRSEMLIINGWVEIVLEAESPRSLTTHRFVRSFIVF